MYLFHILIHVLVSYTHSCTRFIYSFMYSFHILIHVLVSYTHSCTRFIYSFMYPFHILIHVLISYTHSCTQFIYSFMYSFIYSFTYSFHILIHVLMITSIHIAFPIYFLFHACGMWHFIYLYVLFVLYETVLSPVGVQNRDSSSDTHRYFSYLCSFTYQIYLYFYFLFISTSFLTMYSN